MPKRTNAFQSLIRWIETELAPVGARVTESEELIDLVTGERREVDVLVRAVVGQHKIALAIECRDHQRRADVTWIDNLIGKYKNLPVSSVIAVSRSGFTKNALKKAEMNNIKTLTLELAQVTRWLHLLNNPDLSVIVFSAPLVATINVLQVGGSRQFIGDFFRATVFSVEGNRLGTCLQLACEALTSGDFIERAKKNVRIVKDRVSLFHIKQFDKGTFCIDNKGTKHEFFAFKIHAQFYTEVTNIQFEAFKYGDVELLRGEGIAFDRNAQFVLINEAGVMPRRRVLFSDV